MPFPIGLFADSQTCFSAVWPVAGVAPLVVSGPPVGPVGPLLAPWGLAGARDLLPNLVLLALPGGAGHGAGQGTLLLLPAAPLHGGLCLPELVLHAAAHGEVALLHRHNPPLAVQHEEGPEADVLLLLVDAVLLGHVTHWVGGKPDGHPVETGLIPEGGKDW